MLHMNKQERYKQLWRDFVTVYESRHGSAGHYIAGLSMGGQIAIGLSNDEYRNLFNLFEAARHAK